MKLLEKLVFPAFVLALLALTPDAAQAQSCKRFPDQPKCQTDPGPTPDPGPELDPFAWMHPDVGVAHGAGLDGTGSLMITVDSFSGTTYSGNLDGTTQSLTHGAWTYLESHLIAPNAVQIDLDHDIDATTNIRSVYDETSTPTSVNLSFGLLDYAGTNVHAPDYELGQPLWDSIVAGAWDGSAVYVKAAGNTSGRAVDGTYTIRAPMPVRVQDSLNLLLIGAPGALYVGALDGGTIASYSTIAGNDTRIQDMFLVAEVRDDLTNLAGTSFAAPIVTGYAAIIGEKYHSTLIGKSNPGALVVDRLLDTARTDTISNFSASCTQTILGVCTRSSVYGVGEASLSAALSPNGIPN